MMSALRTLATAAVLLTGCADSGPEADSYEGRGYIERIEEGGERLLIDHEEIPDFMPPMIMQFKVEDAGETEGLKPGDQIRFDYRVAATRSWIEDIEPTGLRRDPQSREPAASQTGSEPRGAALLEVGTALPDYEFLDEEGRSVSLSDYRGSVVALTFIFTRCPVPEYCPAMMRNFGDADALLKDSPPLAAPWKLVTISFDPENDTPEVMKRYGEAFDYDPQTWDLLTTRSLEPIDGIARNVGLKFGKSNGSYLHNLRTVVVDPEGRIARVFTDEDWSPEELAAEMRRAAGGI